MSYLLDTDICSAHPSREVTFRDSSSQNQWSISSVGSIGELSDVGSCARQIARRSVHGVEDLLKDLVVVDTTIDVARKFGELRAALLDSGRPTPQMDLLIAAESGLVHGHSRGARCQRTRVFPRYAGLSIEDQPQGKPAACPTSEWQAGSLPHV